MKARRIFLIIGGVILLLLLALVALAVYFHREEEREKNRARVAQARKANPKVYTPPGNDGAGSTEPAPEPTSEDEVVITPADAGVV